MLSNNAEGYPLIYVDHDGNVLCNECAQKNIDNGCSNSGEIVGQVYWEGETMLCDGCNCDLESAYGPVEIKKELSPLMKRFYETM